MSSMGRHDSNGVRSTSITIFRSESVASGLAEKRLQILEALRDNPVDCFDDECEDRQDGGREDSQDARQNGRLDDASSTPGYP